jgi:hypothetical protein
MGHDTLSTFEFCSQREGNVNYTHIAPPRTLAPLQISSYAPRRDGEEKKAAAAVSLRP